MDNLTHGLLGIAVGMARPRDGGPERLLRRLPTDTDRAVVLTTFLAAELPDLDIFWGLLTGGGPMTEYIYHRGPTHALVTAPVVALLAALVARLFWRRARLSTLWLWGLLSVLVAHLLNDWLTGWGTRLLWPFADARLALDWMPIVDPLFTLPILAAVIAAARRPLWRRRATLGIVGFYFAYAILYRGTAHTLVARAVSQAYADQPVVQYRVSPSLFNPVAWSFTVDLGDRYEQGQALPFGPIAPNRTVLKAKEDPVVRAVRAMPELQPFFAQFAYPLVTYEVAEGGYAVRLADIRYEFAGRSMDHFVLLSPDLQRVEFLSERR